MNINYVLLNLLMRCTPKVVDLLLIPHVDISRVGENARILDKIDGTEYNFTRENRSIKIKIK